MIYDAQFLNIWSIIFDFNLCWKIFVKRMKYKNQKIDTMINLYRKSFISVIMYVRETRIFEKFPRNKFIIFCTHFKFLFFLPWGLFSSIFSLCFLELPVC